MVIVRTDLSLCPGDAFKAADGLRGMSREDQLKCHLAWRTPDPRSYRVTTEFGVTRTRMNRSILHVSEPRLCTIERNIVRYKGLENPDAETFVVVETQDLHRRTLHFVLQNHKNYLLALPRGNSVSVTNNERLFTTGRWPLVPKTDISVDDLEFIYQVIEDHFGGDDVHND